MVGITIDSLGVVYRHDSMSIQALDDVSITLKPGKIIACVGESGSGKTTLGKALMGLLPEHAGVEGSIRINGQEIVGLDERTMNELRWSRIAMVFQNISESLNPVLRIINQVAEPLIRTSHMKKHEARKQAEAALVSIGLLPDEIHRYPHELSGGQVQRALLAMALILDPQVLVLDEPTAALDAKTKSLIAGRILHIRDEGKAVLLITHDLDLAKSVADEVTVLYSGQIMETLPAADLFNNTLHPYSRGLCRSYPAMDTMRDLGGIRGDMSLRTVHHIDRAKILPLTKDTSAHGCVFYSRCTQSVTRCSEEMPPLKVRGGHSVRCLRGGVTDIIALNSLAKDYGPVKALRPTNLRIQSGEIFCLVGETGSGKTTLANIAAGLLKQDQGSRTFDGRDMDVWMSDDYPSLAKKIGVVYQNAAESVSHRLSLFEIVAEPLRIQKTVREEEKIRRAVYRAFADVRLSADPVFLRRYPHELNMGALQRVAIARALVTDPVFIVADEPTSALDPSIQAKMLKLLLDLQTQKGLTMLFVTHNIGLARKIADHVGVMLAGYLVETGPAVQVLSYPAHPYTRMLLESARYSTDSAVNAPGRDRLKGCPFGSRCGEVRDVCVESFPGQMVGLNHNNHRTLCPFSKKTVGDEKKQILH